jgi:hypothetical protein
LLKWIMLEETIIWFLWPGLRVESIVLLSKWCAFFGNLIDEFEGSDIKSGWMWEEKTDAKLVFKHEDLGLTGEILLIAMRMSS